MAGRTKEVFLNPRSYTYPPKDGVFLGVAPLSGEDVFEVPDYSPNDADREWVASQLGDVPRRHTAEQWTLAELEGMNYLIEHAKRYEFNRIPDYFGETVPVESLGRDHE